MARLTLQAATEAMAILLAVSLARGSQRCVKEPVLYIRVPTGPGAAAGWVQEPRGFCTSQEGALRWGEDENKERSHLPLGKLVPVRGLLCPLSPCILCCGELCLEQLRHRSQGRVFCVQEPCRDIAVSTGNT